MHFSLERGPPSLIMTAPPRAAKGRKTLMVQSREGSEQRMNQSTYSLKAPPLSSFGILQQVMATH